jgi:hypothetical protein
MKEGNTHHDPVPLSLPEPELRRSVHLPGRLLRSPDGAVMTFPDTWTRRATRWFCTTCKRLNPDITSTCLTEGCNG